MKRMDVIADSTIRNDWQWLVFQDKRENTFIKNKFSFHENLDLKTHTHTHLFYLTASLRFWPTWPTLWWTRRGKYVIAFDPHNGWLFFFNLTWNKQHLWVVSTWFIPFHLQNVIISACCVFAPLPVTLSNVFNQQLAASNLSNLE